jgi:hypothetical protein
MSNKPMPWIKQYPARLQDVRLAKLNDRHQLRFYQLYLLAGHLNADGAFVQDDQILSVTDIAYLLRVKDVKQLESDLAMLKKAKLLKVNGHGPYIADFKEEQIAWSEKQAAERERQKKSRQSQRSHTNVTRDANVTTPNVTLLEQEQEQDKSLVVVVVADAFKFYDEHIGKRSTHIDKELTAMFKKNSVNLGKAICITADQDKHTLAYLKGVFKNLQKGTVKPEPRGAKYQPAMKKLDPYKQVKL